MSRRRSLIIWVLGLLLLVVACLPAHSAQDKTSRIKDRISRQKDRIEEEKKSLSELSQRERELFAGVAQLEKKIRTTRQRLQQQKAELAEIKRQEERLREEAKQLERRMDGMEKELHRLLRRLWPLYLHNDPLRIGDVSSWEEADRKFTWLASVYTMAEKRLQRLNAQQEKLQANLEKQERIRSKAAAKVSQVKHTEDALLQQKLSYLHRLQKIRAQRLAKEEQLEHIRDTISELEYKLKLLSTRRIEHLKGHLPWPVQGDVIARFDPKSDPPQEGIGLKVRQGSKVEAVCWGKVVYDDTLRGFGRVVIIFHGNNYYTLYAYLNRSSVRLGQDVEKGEPIGEAGYYPQAEGTGLYFELRSGKHPIDPGPWLGKPA